MLMRTLHVISARLLNSPAWLDLWYHFHPVAPSSDTPCTAAPWRAQLRDSQGTVSQHSASPTARLPSVWCSAPQTSGSSAAPNSDFCLLSLVGPLCSASPLACCAAVGNCLSTEISDRGGAELVNFPSLDIINLGYLLLCLLTGA